MANFFVYSIIYTMPSGYSRKYSKSVFAKKEKKLNKAATKQVAKIAKTIVNKSIETKFHDIANIAFPDDGNGTIIPLTDIPQATTPVNDFSRVGDKCQPVSIEMRLAMSAGTLVGATTPTTLRLVLVQWHGQFGQDDVTQAKIFGNVGTTSLKPLRPYNHDNRKKFRVLWDRFIELGYNSDSIQLVTKKFNVRMKPVNYYGGSTTDQMNGLYLVLQSGVDILGVLPSVSYAIRTNFKDA